MRRSFLVNVICGLLICGAGAGLAQVPDCSLDGLERPFHQSRQMPLFKGCTTDQIAVALKRLELRPQITAVANGGPAGLIVDQSPPAQTPVTYATAMTLYVSNGVAPAAGPTNPGSQTKKPQTPRADISVTGGIDHPGTYVAGRTVVMTFRVTNAGPQSATGVNINVLPANLSDVRVEGDCSSVRCLIPDLGVNAFEVLRVTGAPQAPGPFSVTVEAQGREIDPAPGDNSATGGGRAISIPPTDVTPPIIRNPPPVPEAFDLLLTGVNPSTPVVAGSAVILRFDLSNGGNGTAIGVRLSEKATNLTNVTFSCPASPCNVPVLRPGDAIPIDVHAIAGVPGPFTLMLLATAKGGVAAKSRSVEAPVRGSVVGSPPNWLWWVVGAGGLGLGVLFALGIPGRVAKVWKFKREQRWRASFSVVANVERLAGAAGPIPLSGPAIGISVSVELGHAGPGGTIPILDAVPMRNERKIR